MSIVIRPITTLPDEFIESLTTSISISQIAFEPKYVAMDSDAHWCVFEDMPEVDIENDIWNNATGKFQHLSFTGRNSDIIWTSSLMEIQHKNIIEGSSDIDYEIGLAIVMRSVDEVIEIVKNTKYPFDPKFIAMDSDGDWFVYNGKPMLSGEIWGAFGCKFCGVVIADGDMVYDNWKDSLLNIEYLFEEGVEVKKEISLGTTVSKIKDVIEGFEVDIMGNNNRIADIVLKVSALNEELKGLERINGGISRKIENLKHTVNILNAVRDGSVHD